MNMNIILDSCFSCVFIYEAPPGGTESGNHEDFFRFHAMRGTFGFSRNIAKVRLKMGHFHEIT